MAKSAKIPPKETTISSDIVYQKMSGYVSNLNSILNKHGIKPNQVIERILKQFSTAPIMPNEFRDEKSAINHFNSFIQRVNTQYLDHLTSNSNSEAKSASTSRSQPKDIVNDLNKLSKDSVNNLKLTINSAQKSAVKTDRSAKNENSRNQGTQNLNSQDPKIPSQKVQGQERAVKKDSPQIIQRLINPIKKAAAAFFSLFKPIANRIQSRATKTTKNIDKNQESLQTGEKQKQERNAEPDRVPNPGPEPEPSSALNSKANSAVHSDTFIPPPPPLPEEYFNEAVEAEEDAILSQHYAKHSDTYIPPPPDLPEEFFNPKVEAEEDAIIANAEKNNQTKARSQSEPISRCSAIPDLNSQSKSDNYNPSSSGRLSSVQSRERFNGSNSEKMLIKHHLNL